MSFRSTSKPILVLAALVVVFMFPFFLTGKVLYWGDILLQSYPWRWFIKMMVARGELPLWNPYIFCGIPLVANPQPATYYPLTWLLLPLPSEYAVTLEVALHVLLTGLFMCLYLRQTDRSIMACWIGALSFMFGAFIVTKFQFPPIIRVLPWLPFVLWQVEKAATPRSLTDTPTPRGKSMGPLLIGFGLAMMWLGGHLQVALLCAVFYFGYALTLCASFRGDGTDRAKRFLWAGTIVPGVCMVGLTALQWLPALELMRMSTRTQLDATNALAFSLPPWQLVTLLIPNFFGSPQFGNYWGAGNAFEVSAYAGILPLLLAWMGLRHRCSRYSGIGNHRRRFWIVMGALGLLLAMGQYSPLYRVLYETTPFLKMWRAPARFLLWYVMSISCLAALGWDALLGLPKDALQRWLRKVRWGAFAFAAAFLLMLLANAPLSGAFISFVRLCFTHTDKSAPASDVPALAASLFGGAVLFTAVAVAMFLIACAALSLLAKEDIPRRVTGYAVMGVLIADLFIFGAGFNPYCSAKVFHTAPDSTLTRTLSLQGRGKGGGRVLLPLESINRLWKRYYNYGGFGSKDEEFIRAPLRYAIPNFNMAQGIHQAEGYDAIRYLRYDRKLREWEKNLEWQRRRSRPLVVPAADAIVLSPDPQTSESTQEVLPSRVLSPRAGNLPRVFIQTANLPQRDGAHGPLVLPEWKDEINSISFHGHYRFGPGQLVVMDVAYPGWRCVVNGLEQCVSSFDGVFRSVSLGESEAMGSMFYYPLSFRFGLFVSLVFVGMIVGGGVRVMLSGTAASTPPRN